MDKTINHRIESIDMLRGLVMVIMALDHARTYFYAGTFHSDPTDLTTTTPWLFLTRWITHLCAPVFVFLAGTSAFLYGVNQDNKHALFRFLLIRGIWLILLEITIVDLVFWFDPSFSITAFQVIWALGISMVVLSFLVYLPPPVIFLIGLVIVAGHNLLDTLTVEGEITSLIWSILYKQTLLPLAENRIIFFYYPILPWIGLMALGYCMGVLYQPGFASPVRKKWLVRLGLSCIAVFIVLRGLNVYGDPSMWKVQENSVFTFLSFINLTKYPPSLLFLLMTIGPALIYLSAVENIKNSVSRALVMIGQVPLFFYVFHFFIIHAMALISLALLGLDWQAMVVTAERFLSGTLAQYGYSLTIVYAVWVGTMILAYPLCQRFRDYKAQNRHKKWLSYL